MERMLDRIAQGVGIDRAECRRRNLIPADRIPYVKPLKSRAGVPLTIDSGDFPALQARALAEIGYAEFDARRREAARAARAVASAWPMASSRRAGPFESARVRIAPSGQILGAGHPDHRPHHLRRDGLVIMPFLPGDSLLFAAGAFLGLAGIDPLTSIAIITAAAIAGDALNYTIGSSRWGQKLAHSRWIKPAHMERAREYFARFGAMTITVARFVPIARTLALSWPACRRCRAAASTPTTWSAASSGAAR